MTHKRHILFAMAGLLILFALLVLGARRTALTADEPTYIAWGYALWAKGQEAFPLLVQRGYPPLLIRMEAALLYWADPDIPVDRLPGWPHDYVPYLEAFTPYLRPLERTKMASRMPVVFLTVVLGAVVFRWAREAWGGRAACIALAALAFDPTLLAHGRLAHSDAGVVALGTAALYATWRWARKPSWRWALGAGGLLGLTMLAKLSGVLWVAAGGVATLYRLVRWHGQGPIRRHAAQCAAALGLALLLLWAGYGIETGSVHPVPFFLPAPTHRENLRFLDRYADTYFALGQWSERGWWWYFPLAFAIKNPLPLLIGLAIGLIALLRRPRSPLHILPPVLFATLYAGVAIAERLNLGYRHMLPIHPTLYLVAGSGLGQLAWGQGWRSPRRWCLLLLGLWYALGTVRVFPYEISFFKELVGGPEGG